MGSLGRDHKRQRRCRPDGPAGRVGLGALLATVALGPRGAFAQPLPASGVTRASGDRPWRAHEALGLRWLRFGLEQRTRFEHLASDFRVANPGNATGLFLRTLLSAEVRGGPFALGGELADARAWTFEGTPLNPGLVNPLELLQGYLALRGENLFLRGDTASLSLGRLTIDLGSRRLVARNEFRNTINAFTGLDAQWTSPSRDLLRVFAVVPVVRLPSDPAGLGRNAIEFDRENPAALLWALFFQSRPLAAQVVVEAYLLNLHERDSDFAPSANRRLHTPGLRVLRAPTPGGFDFQFELMGQFGRSRASAAASDTTDLEHLAFSVHASLGHRFDRAWAPRVVLQYDYASGDASPDDGVNHRFDPLFAARRFEFGQTGLYGAIARGNVNAPGLRVELQPHRRVDAFASYRAVWLASARDAWTTAGLRDVTGASGTFVGQQVEVRLRWQVLPRNLALEVGSSVFVRGGFAVRAPGGETAPAVYVHTQLTTTL